MKRIYLVCVTALLLASCQSASEKVSGAYTGTYSSSDLPVSTGTGTATLSSTGSEEVSISFASAGNPTIVINEVSVTQILNTYILDVPSSSSASLSATVVGNMFDMAYNDTVSISFHGTK